MVSALSQRLLSGYSSNSSSGSSSKKRPSKSKDGKTGSLSGYSADREETSGTPPIVSIDLLGESRKVHAYDPNGCEKRRKTHELQFAASTVKQDLARAGFPYPELDKDKQIMSSPGGGVYRISLKGVRLVRSKEVETPSVVSNSSLNSTASDYEQLMAACYEAYRYKPNQLKGNDGPPPSQDSDESTSSVSDTESDSCDSNGNGGSSVFVIPPLLEDSPKPHSKDVENTGGYITSYNIISSAASAVTMSEILSLCKQPR